MPTNYPAGLQPSEYAEYDAYLASQGGGVTNPPPVAPPATQPDGAKKVTYVDGKWFIDGQPINNPFGEAGDLSSYTTSGNQDEGGQTIWNNGQVGGNAPGSQYWANPNSASGNQQLNEATLKELGGLVQFRPGVGGYSEAIDPSKVSWSDKYGLLTDPSNIAKPDEGNFAERYALKIAMAALAATPMLTGGIAGVGAGGLASGGAVPTIADAGLLSAAGIAPEAGALAAAPALATGGAAGGIAGTGLTLGQIGTGIRTAGSALGLGRALGIGGNSGGGSGGLLNTLAQGIGGYNESQDNKATLDDFKQAIKDMIIQGDPYAPKRADAIRRLGELEANPGSVTANPLFKSMSEKSQEDLSRIYASRGMNVSGNEMGGLQENFLANMNKFYGEEWNRIAKEAGVNVDPSTMASAGIRAAGDVAKGQFNRTAGNNALIQRLLGGGGSGGGSGGDIWSIIGKLFSDDNSWDWPDGWSSDENFLDGVS